MSDKQNLINRLTAAHRILENARVWGGATRTAGLHPQRCAEVMDAITEAIVEIDAPPLNKPEERE